MQAARCGAYELLVHVDASQPQNGFSGKVLNVGEQVHEVVSGQSVFGQASVESVRGARIWCKWNRVAIKPAKLGDQEAAVLASVGPLALQAIRLAGVNRGMRLLVYDASSCFGALVLQIAKSLGAHVTGLCPDRNVPLVWDLGADAVGALERDGGRQGFDAIICSEQSASSQSKKNTECSGAMVRVSKGSLALRTNSASDWRAYGAEADCFLLEALVRMVEHENIFPITSYSLGT